MSTTSGAAGSGIRQEHLARDCSWESCPCFVCLLLCLGNDIIIWITGWLGSRRPPRQNFMMMAAAAVMIIILSSCGIACSIISSKRNFLLNHFLYGSGHHQPCCQKIDMLLPLEKLSDALCPLISNKYRAWGGQKNVGTIILLGGGGPSATDISAKYTHTALRVYGGYLPSSCNGAV